MKKLFALFVCVCVAMTTTFSQEHMLFRGVPIDGSVESFAQSLASKGFTKIGVHGGNAVLSGKFTGRDVLIMAYSSPASKKVYCVVVVYQMMDDSWSILENLYNELKGMLTQKYGDPALVNETTTDESSVYTKDKLFALRMDRLIWESSWLVENGAITIKMVHQDGLGEVVAMLYEDKINAEATTNEYIDEL